MNSGTQSHMQWELAVEEQSAGIYICEAIQGDRVRVSRTGPEPIIGQVVREALDFNSSSPSERSLVLYELMSSLPILNERTYHDEAFGSWYVNGRDNRPAIVYDGRDGLLEVRAKDGTVLWGHKLTSSQVLNNEFFRLVL